VVAGPLGGSLDAHAFIADATVGPVNGVPMTTICPGATTLTPPGKPTPPPGRELGSGKPETPWLRMHCESM
jgi:hypothetical protein